MDLSQLAAETKYQEAAALAKAGQAGAARSAALEAVQRHQNHAKAWNLLGFLAYREGQAIHAGECFERALDTDPTLGEAAGNLARVRLEAGDMLGALRVIEESLKHRPSPVGLVDIGGGAGAARDLAKLAREHKLWHVAWAAAHEAVQGSPDDAESRAILVEARNFVLTFYVREGQITPQSKIGEFLRGTIRTQQPRVIVDVGAASGLGSTRTFADLAASEGLQPKIYALEAEPATFELLKRNTATMAGVIPMNAVLHQPERMPPLEFYLKDMRQRSDLLDRFSEQEIRDWHDHVAKQLSCPKLDRRPAHELIPEQVIDIAMIDADCFFAADTFETIRARTNTVVLDDVAGYKNIETHERLSRDPEWEQLACELSDRHGWSAFRRRTLLKAA